MWDRISITADLGGLLLLGLFLHGNLQAFRNILHVKMRSVAADVWTAAFPGSRITSVFVKIGGKMNILQAIWMTDPAGCGPWTASTTGPRMMIWSFQISPTFRLQAVPNSTFSTKWILPNGTPGFGLLKTFGPMTRWKERIFYWPSVNSVLSISVRKAAIPTMRWDIVTATYWRKVREFLTYPDATDLSRSVFSATHLMVR